MPLAMSSDGNRSASVVEFRRFSLNFLGSLQRNGCSLAAEARVRPSNTAPAPAQWYSSSSRPSTALLTLKTRFISNLCRSFSKSASRSMIRFPTPISQSSPLSSGSAPCVL
ncbi:hypothetical protein QQF64_031227, partial [Cirrhinus molitorella]